MKDFLRQLLNEMKDKVMNNLQEVKENEVSIREMLTNHDSYERAFNIQMRYKYNRKLLNENIDFLEVQHKVVNLLSKYGQSDFMNTPFQTLLAQCLDVDYLKETIEGRIVFNENHPYYLDEQFINLLLQHYIANEDYGECKRLTAIKEKIKNKGLRTKS
jgi:hypothetical protein